MKNLTTMIVLLLPFLFCGCSMRLFHEPEVLLVRNDSDLKTVSISSSLLDTPEIEQMQKVFQQHGLKLTVNDTDSSYFIEKFSISGEYKELYKNTSDDILYLNITSNLNAIVRHKFSQNEILNNYFKESQRFHPNHDFYSQRSWYQAEIQFESQQKLMDAFAQKLAVNIKTYEKNS